MRADADFTGILSVRDPVEPLSVHLCLGVYIVGRRKFSVQPDAHPLKRRRSAFHAGHGAVLLGAGPAAAAHIDLILNGSRHACRLLSERRAERRRVGARAGQHVVVPGPAGPALSLIFHLVGKDYLALFRVYECREISGKVTHTKRHCERKCNRRDTLKNCLFFHRFLFCLLVHDISPICCLRSTKTVRLFFP